MLPILFTIGPVSVFSFSVFLVLAWLVFSFVLWKILRQYAVDEDKVFDITFYLTLSAFTLSRVVFVLFHWELFADTLLKIPALWIQPGLSLYGGLLGALFTLVFMSRSQKIRLGLLLDAFVQAFGASAIIGSIGTFLDATTAGEIAAVPWAMRLAGQVGLRHPVAGYQFIAFFVISFLVRRYARKSVQYKLPFGMVGLVFFLLFSTAMFVIEFTSVRAVYWISLSASQWLLIAFFAESLGILYVRGGGRERIRPVVNKMIALRVKLLQKMKGTTTEL